MSEPPDDDILPRGLVIASNRGPVAFQRGPDGELVPRRGAGGLVTALTHVMARTGGLWMAAAITPGDREMVRRQGNTPVEVPVDQGTIRLRYLTFERDTYDRYYNRISNWMFWFLQHSMWNLPTQPRFDHQTRISWDAYRAVNRRFAEALAEEVADAGGATPVVLNDYHLMLVAPHLRALVPDSFVFHFTHIPWCQPDLMRVLPAHIGVETLEGMLANDLLGFQTIRWARNFMWCCQELLRADVDVESGLVRYQDRETRVRHYPISVDVDSLLAATAPEQAAEHIAWLEGILEGRKLVLRIDRLELSKNVVRGLRAFEELLREHPEWQGNATHVALLYPSRRALSEYRAYEAEVLDTSDRINAELGTDDWQPIVIVNEDNYPRALASLTRYDVLLVNPIADGMNLVSKEGPAVNRNDGVLVLSRNAGSWYELGHAALTVNPYDVSEMADAIHTALTMDPEERRVRAELLAEVVERNNPWKWLSHQLEDISPYLRRTPGTD
ncbi:MAG TPA: trehalose-6-phosphate synthase [Actinomycetota bacterium]|nr:trehalose-6-phosphate synthase [Actinomycetota bacterium]